MPDIRFTEKGYVAPRGADFLVWIRDEYEALTELEVDWGRDTFLGQITLIMARRLAELAESSQGIYDAFNVNNARGLHLDSLALIVGVRRREATHSNTQLRVEGNPGVFIGHGALVEDVNGTEWEIIDDRRIGWEVTIVGIDEIEYRVDIQRHSESESFSYTPTPDDELEDIAQNLAFEINKSSIMVSAFVFNGTRVILEPFSRDFMTIEVTPDPNMDIERGVSYVGSECTLPGPIQVSEGQIDRIVSPIDGWSSVINDSRIFVGLERETDAQLRARRMERLQQIGAASLPAIRSALMSLDQSQAVVAMDNDTADPQTVAGVEMTPKSVAVVVYPGPIDDDFQTEIIATLYDKMPAGIEMIGEVEAIVTGLDGFDKVIRFSYAEEVETTVQIDLNLEVGVSLLDVEEQVQEAVRDYFLTLSVGTPVRRLPIMALLDTIEGIGAATVKINEENADLILGLTQIAVLDSTTTGLK